MKKRLIFAIVAIAMAALFVFVGCGRSSTNSVRGEGSRVLHTIDASNFTSIDISGGYDITWISSPVFNVTLDIQENLFEYIDAYVAGDVFFLSSERNFIGYTPRLRIYAPFVDEIRLSGAADITGWDTIDLDTLTISIAGASDINLTGRVENLHLTTAGASDVRLFDLIATHAVISSAGASNIDVHATETLHIELAGIGNVTYDGNPTITQSVSGLGVIRAR